MMVAGSAKGPGGAKKVKKGPGGRPGKGANNGPKGASPRHPPRRRSGAGEGPSTCEVPGCGKEADRSISFRKAREAMEDWKLEKDGPRRIHICKEHYRDFKKATRRERDMDRAGWMERTGRYDGGR